MGLSAFILSDCIISIFSALISILALRKTGIRAGSVKWVVAIGLYGLIVGLANLLFDMRWFFVPARLLPLMLFLSGASKGLLLGLLLSLILFKQLRGTSGHSGRVLDRMQRIHLPPIKG
jgi:hypothetical protein